MNLEGLPNLIEDAFRAVVEISVQDDEGERGGSGFLTVLGGKEEPSDLVITNAHVAGEAGELAVSFKDGNLVAAERIGVHPLIDLAVLRLEEELASPLVLRNQGDHRLGEYVIALGHPATFSWTATSGLLAGLDRPETSLTTGLPMTMIQTDADVNPGNSGGPLVGLDGKAVGVNTSGMVRIASLSKVSFAIPAHSARLAALSILHAEGDDHVPRPWTGIAVRNDSWKAPPEVATSLGIRSGLRIAEEPAHNSPAKGAGLCKGDILVSIGETTVDDAGDLFTWMLEPDCLEREVSMSFLRDGELESTRLQAIERPASSGSESPRGD